MRLLLCPLILLAACNSPSPQFRGIAPTRVTVEGSVFDVRVNDNRAEAIRINPQYAPRFGPIRARAGQAMALVSGCRVVSVGGDQALAFGRLDCGKGPPPKSKAERHLDCVPERGTELRQFDGYSVELDCYPA